MYLLGPDGVISRTDASAHPQSSGALAHGVSLVVSASDLKTASECEWGFLRRLDGKLGRAEAIVEPEDPMNRRAAELGDEHEERQLADYRARFGAGVIEVARPDGYDRSGLRAAAAATAAALTSGADVVFQATFFDESASDGIDFVGFADFLVRMPAGGYRVQDTKLARSPRVTALLQLAAYARQLRRIGVEVDPVTELLLGDGSVSAHRLADVEPVFARRWQRLMFIVHERLGESSALAWRDDRYSPCGSCAACAPEVIEHRDLLLVAGMRLTQRAALIDAGIRTIDELAVGAPAEGMNAATFEGLRAQAQLQCAGLDAPVGTIPPYELLDGGAALAALPEPDPGDIFFDFEGDPLYTEDATTSGSTPRWGLDYLFGLVDVDENFTAFWAHDFAEERQALIDFIAFVRQRRERYPNMHIYHYAPYERSHLSSLSTRHGACEAEVDELLRDHVLVDLYAIVRKSLRVGTSSYSIKYLEPLYMGDRHRDASGVTKGDDSVAEYARARQLRLAGDMEGWQQVIDAIADYNTYDCVSTLRLRDWLLDRSAEVGIAPTERTARAESDEEQALEKAARRREIDALVATLQGFAGDVAPAERSSDQQAYALAAAAVEYHWREQKIFWWEHFSRLTAPVTEFADTRDVFTVAEATVDDEWHKPPRKRKPRRHITLRGQWAPGSSVRAGLSAFALYDQPVNIFVSGLEPGARAYTRVTIEQVFDDRIVISEMLPTGNHEYAGTPIALTPAPPPNASILADAIAEWAQKLATAHPDWPLDASAQLLRRTPPALTSGTVAEIVQSTEPADRIDAVTRTVLDLDHSYLAVQGPPGTGKTFLGSRVIAQLVQNHGYKIGVVGQSHKTSENMLAAVVAAGLDARRVGKRAKAGESLDDAPFTEIRAWDTFIENNPDGCVIGGTAWTFANGIHIPRGSLDLLVIDEAGQYSLAATIAAGASARNLLLLGDPQQLPQVSQAAHPEPIDTSALGWLSDGHDVLPAEFGFFLAESRRMHPEVTEPVSQLSYEGQLHSHPWGATRRLAAIDPGLHALPVLHWANTTESVEEARRVRDLVGELIGREWSDPHASPPRDREPLTEHDIIVVTPYNAQLHRLRETLDAAGFTEVRVGTVDKFQGQEAPIAIISLAASSAADVPRGMEFLLMPNRLNVAISRAKWAAYLVYSPALLDHLPTTPEAVARLSAFITLVGANTGGRQ